MFSKLKKNITTTEKTISENENTNYVCDTDKSIDANCQEDFPFKQFSSLSLRSDSHENQLNPGSVI